MSKKKTLLTILAVVLVCCIAVAGTLAVLSMSANNPVVNTFTATSSLIDDEKDGGSFTLKENVAVRNDDGSYSLKQNVFTGDKDKDGNVITGNTYKVLPNTEIPKNPFITITGKTDAPAYLYVEVIDGFKDTSLSYIMNDCWTEVTGVTGPNTGKIYVYTVDGKPAVLSDKTDEETLAKIEILKNNEVSVADGKTGIGNEDLVGLAFVAYLGQASVGTPAQAFEAANFAAVSNFNALVPKEWNLG